MTTLLLISNIILWLVAVSLAFLLLGALRALGLLSWRMEQLEATTPSRLGRSGLKPGKKAPEFTLPSVSGAEVSLHDFAGRNVVLIFVQTGCSPCKEIVPELNRLHGQGEPSVLVVNNGERAAAGHWAEQVKAEFPVLVQKQFSLSKRYQAFATPFAFLIDERGIIRATGIVANRQHLGYVLSGARWAGKFRNAAAENERVERNESQAEADGALASG
jgi:methylamine dehydrogenase accessory protein MauD